MKILISFFVVLFNFFFVNAQKNYFNTLATDFSKLNTTYSTTIISQSKDIGVCTCDLTPNSCDYLCCCDQDCPNSITTTWMNDPSNVCLDKRKFF